VDEHLRRVDYRFWLVIQIFFHSGSRIKELVQLKRSDVDLDSQKFYTLVRKRRVPTVLPRTIKDEALPYWEEFIEGADSDQYLFGIDFLPAAKPIIPNTITRRWKQRVKNDLEISADLYSLKHLNTTETVDMIGEEFAAKQNGHTSAETVKQWYDVGRSDREHRILKAVNNKFA
jgi:integrase